MAESDGDYRQNITSNLNSHTQGVKAPEWKLSILTSHVKLQNCNHGNVSYSSVPIWFPGLKMCLPALKVLTLYVFA